MADHLCRHDQTASEDGVMIVAIIIGSAIAWLVSEIVNAPLGWEDSETGFHYGEPPETHMRWGR